MLSEAETPYHPLHGLLLRLGMSHHRRISENFPDYDDYNYFSPNARLAFIVYLSGKGYTVVRYVETEFSDLLRDEKAEDVVSEDDLNRFLQGTTLGNMLFQYKLNLLHDTIRS